MEFPFPICEKFKDLESLIEIHPIGLSVSGFVLFNITLFPPNEGSQQFYLVKKAGQGAIEGFTVLSQQYGATEGITVLGHHNSSPPLSFLLIDNILRPNTINAGSIRKV